MPIRMTDTEIWDEDWFIDLPNEYKLLYQFIKDKCDHSGMWRPNRRKFSMVVHGKTIHYDEFLSMVNKDPDTGNKVNRIIVLENGKWFITRFVSFQLGGKFNIKIGAHRGAFELLVRNGIHVKDVPKMDWGEFQNLEMEDLIKLAHDKGLYRLSLGYVKAMHSEIEKAKEKEQEPALENIGKGGLGEKPKFKLQHLYDLDWNQVDTRERDFKGITEPAFNHWKKFVDWVIGKGYDELFRAIFVTPADFSTLVLQKGFVEEVWEPVVKKMLSTGIKPEQNLYFRIPDFMKHAKIGKGATSTVMSAGASNYDDMQKW